MSQKRETPAPAPTTEKSAGENRTFMEKNGGLFVGIGVFALLAIGALLMRFANS